MGANMSNYSIKIISMGRENLEAAMNIAFSANRKATHFSVSPRNTSEKNPLELGEIATDYVSIILSKNSSKKN